MKRGNRSPLKPVSGYEIYQRAVESAPNGMIMVHKKGRITLINQQAESIFGSSMNTL